MVSVSSSGLRRVASEIRSTSNGGLFPWLVAAAELCCVKVSCFLREIPLDVPRDTNLKSFESVRQVSAFQSNGGRRLEARKSGRRSAVSTSWRFILPHFGATDPVESHKSKLGGFVNFPAFRFASLRLSRSVVFSVDENCTLSTVFRFFYLEQMRIASRVTLPPLLLSVSTKRFEIKTIVIRFT